MYLSHIHFHNNISFNTKEYRIFEEKSGDTVISWFSFWYIWNRSGMILESDQWSAD
jgi:hypothetical protein